MTLTDTGPLVALLNRRDINHESCVAAVYGMPSGGLVTTWPCFTEAMHLLHRAGGIRFQAALWEMKSAGGLHIVDLTPVEADRARALMIKYGDAPMDLADATLVAVAEERGYRSIFTVDKHFRAFRLADGSVLAMMP